VANDEQRALGQVQVVNPGEIAVDIHGEVCYRHQF
jgi:hypothetical protein